MAASCTILRAVLRVFVASKASDNELMKKMAPSTTVALLRKVAAPLPPNSA